jgi:branched-chain amino acid transport system permease protein
MIPVTASKRRMLPLLEGVLLVLFLVLPLAVNDFWVLFVTRVFILGLLALSFDLVWGYAGILSFGQALFFGVAGYSCALLATHAGITSILLLMPVAALAGLIVSIALAFLVILGKRVPTTVFIALGTLTGSYVVERLARGWSYVGGQNGIPSLPRLTVFSHEIAEGPAYYYFALVILTIVYLGLRWLTRSQFGLVLAGIREQEARIAFFGYHVQNYKGVVFAIAGLIAGLSGGL